MTKRLLFSLLFSLLLSLSFAACSDDDDGSNDDASTDRDATADDAAQQGDSAQGQPDGSATDSSTQADAQVSDADPGDALVGDARIADAEVVDGQVADAQIINLCPARDPAGNTCGVVDAQCESGSACCTCAEGSTCNRWFCADPGENARACPELAPRLGTKCEATKEPCSYCTAKGPFVYNCVDGGWELDEFVVTCRAG